MSYRRQSEQTLAHAVGSFLPLARKLARRYARDSDVLEDLVQVAEPGLVNAIAGLTARLNARV